MNISEALCSDSLSTKFLLRNPYVARLIADIPVTIEMSRFNE